MTQKTEAKIDHLVINSPYREPESHWRYDGNAQTFIREAGRRPAGYVVANPNANRYNDPGRFIELELVNRIRPRVKAWREAGYPGATGVTRKLLAHWWDGTARQYPFFFCQLDAIETLIWLAEAPAADKVGIDIPGDGSLFPRVCTKLCTGGGKTIVMALLIAWMTCNKAVYPQDRRFSKNVLIVAPNLTVKSRLQVLRTGGEENYYTQFDAVPSGLTDLLHQGRVLVLNWQALSWETDEAIAKRRSVDKRGARSDEAYVRDVLGELAGARNLLVINDEAHHAWRKNPEVKVKLSKEEKEAEQQATVWVSGLDRIDRARHILACYDFSATPFAPSGKRNDEEALFGWIVSDFGLTDGIESGLVKTPRVVVRDDAVPDAETFKSKLYHIYADETVKENINQAIGPENPLPDLVMQAYTLLGKDWQALYNLWLEKNVGIPPVMITVANRTETAARIKFAFEHQHIEIPELCEPEHILHIDSKELERDDAPEELRDAAGTVGQRGKRGEQIRNVISVGMLSEGWDARTVTHIMGLRAFSSQLLCEQVVGRGLRRASYDMQEGSELFAPEYVNIFGIPFTFLPHEGGEGEGPRPTPPKTQIEVRRDRPGFEICWPNIIRLDRVMRQKLSLDLDRIPTLELNAANTRLSAELAPVVDGQTDFAKLTEIDLEKLSAGLRMQNIVFKASARVYEMMTAQSAWQREGTKLVLLGQVVRLVEKYLSGGAISIFPQLFETLALRRRIILMLNMERIVSHLWQFIQSEQTEKLVPVLDPGNRVRSTGDMPTWYTGRPCAVTRKSHISHCVYDSAWEATEAYALERSPRVAAWAKNDHLGFDVLYTFEGIVRRYVPDYLVRLDNGKTLVLETKGRDSEQNKAKRAALAEWVEAVNGTGDFGQWTWAVSFNPADVDGILDRM